MADSTWTGAVNTLWNTAGNWTAGVPGAGFTATFTGTASVGIDVLSTGVGKIVVVAGTVTLSASGGNLATGGALELAPSAGATLTVAAGIGGAGGVTKTGLGTAQLVASNTFLGTVTVSAGTLVTAAGALAATSDIVNDATLTAVNCGSGCYVSGSGDTTFSGANLTLGVVDVGGTLTFSAVTGTITLGSLAGIGQLSVAGPSLVITNGGTTFIGPLIGFCQLTAPAVGGTFVLANSNTYTLGTVVNGGTLKAGSANAFGSGTISLSGGTLDLDLQAVTNSIDLNGGALGNGANYAGPISVSTGTLNINFIPSATAVTASGSAALSLGGASLSMPITITGTNTLTGGANYSGTVSLSPLASMQIPPGNNLAGTADVSATADLNIGGAHTGSINNSGTVTIDNGTAASTPVNVYIGACGSTYAVQQP